MARYKNHDRGSGSFLDADFKLREAAKVASAGGSALKGTPRKAFEPLICPMSPTAPSSTPKTGDGGKTSSPGP